jgi:hypothetical protein
VSHVIKTYFGDDATFSTLDAVFSSSMKGSRVVYQCIGNNSQGVAKDTVTIQVIGTHCELTLDSEFSMTRN